VAAYYLVHERRTQDQSYECHATVREVDMSDVKTEPVSFCINGLSRYAFGDRWRFGVECEVQDCDVDPWGTLQPFGSFWLWVEGRAIGNTDVSEQLVLAFSTLRASVRGAGRRSDDRFPDMTNLDKLNRVRWVRWGDDDEFRPELWGGKSPDEARAEDVQPYWVVPPGDSPFFDDWEAILLERETSETLVWRHQRGGSSSSQEVELPLGFFSEVCTRACDWFDRFQQARMGSTLREPKEGERPRLLKRIY
jgi:hypothetical protein